MKINLVRHELCDWCKIKRESDGRIVCSEKGIKILDAISQLFLSTPFNAHFNALSFFFGAQRRKSFPALCLFSHPSSHSGGNSHRCERRCMQKQKLERSLNYAIIPRKPSILILHARNLSTPSSRCRHPHTHPTHAMA
jgi:hypothetical protein